MVVADRREKLKFTKLEVAIVDSATVRFVTRSDVERYVFDSVAQLGVAFTTIELSELEQRLSANPYISSCNVYSTIDGVINIEISQRLPRLRLFCESGYNFYLDSTLRVLKPNEKWHPRVPIISGTPCFEFGVDYYGVLDEKNSALDIENLKKLINFVECVEDDSYLQDLVLQIYAFCSPSGETEIDIVPSLGSAKIKFGTLKDTEQKLAKLSHFYRTAYKYAALDSAKVVDIRFHSQVVVR